MPFFREFSFYSPLPQRLLPGPGAPGGHRGTGDNSGLSSILLRSILPRMTATLIYASLFVSEWKRLRLTEDDLRHLERAIMARPDAGDVMAGTGGVRKLRFAPPSRPGGKSGGFRVCYAWFVASTTAVVLLIYPKNELANLTADDKKAIRLAVERIRAGLEKGR